MPMDVEKIVNALGEKKLDVLQEISTSLYQMLQEIHDNDRFRIKLIQILQHKNIVKLLESNRLSLEDILDTYSPSYMLPVNLLGHFSDHMIKKPNANLKEWPLVLREEAKRMDNPEIHVKKQFRNCKKRMAKETSSQDSPLTRSLSQLSLFSHPAEMAPSPTLKLSEKKSSESIQKNVFK